LNIAENFIKDMETKIQKEPVRRAVLGVRLKDEELMAMQKVCKQQGVNYSEFVRFAIKELLEKTVLTKQS
jgi:predicted DNA binding CopG/RHH family protein